MKRNAGALVTAHVARYIGQLAVLVTVAAAGTPLDVGVLAFSLAVATPVFAVLGLGMRTLVLTHRGGHGLAAYFTLRFSSAALAAVVALGILLPLVQTTNWPIVFGVVAMKVADHVLDLVTAWLQSQRRTKYLLLSSLTAAAGNAVGAVACGVLWGAAAAPLGGGVAVLVCSTASAIPLLISMSPRRSSQSAMMELARAGLPLGISFGAVTLLATIPQYMLAGVGDVEGTGRFGVILYLVVAAELIVNPLAQAWTQNRRTVLAASPHPARITATDIAKYTGALAPLMVVGVLAGGALIGPVLGAFYTPSWAEGAVVLVCMLLTPSIFLGAAALAIRNRYRSSLLVVVPALLASGLASLILIPAWGVLGALCAYAVGLSVRAALPLIVLIWKSKEDTHDA